MSNKLFNRILIIGFNWPEPQSSAAGWRMMQLLEMFKSIANEVCFASPAQKTTYGVELMGIETFSIFPNDGEADELLRRLNPDVVVFDRFMMEEQFGWRVRENLPNAIRILDMEDLHFLRKSRGEALAKKGNLENVNLHNAWAFREIAAILRCDLSLVISEEERQLLINRFKIDREQLFYLPFVYNEMPADFAGTLPGFEKRQDMMFIGNFLHQPNYDAVLQLKTVIWPALRKQLPEAELHVYGGYASQKIWQLHKPEDRFLVKDRAPSVDEVMPKYRLQLAPIRFGAGLKGKVFDGIRNALPTVTTKIGAEGIAGKMPFCGAITESDTEFIQKSVDLYQSKDKWCESVQNGIDLINGRFLKRDFETSFFTLLKNRQDHLEKYRTQNFYGQMIWQHRLQSVKYLSRWIEAKNASQNQNILNQK